MNTLHRTFVTLIELITCKKRYIVKPVFTDKVWISNIFRIFEYIFGRAEGIRLETSSEKMGDSNYQKAHTFEAACVLLEVAIREWIKKTSTVRVYIPVLNTPQGIPLFASPYLLAIAFDNGNTTMGGASQSLTCTGSNLYLVAYNYSNTFDGSTPTMTYNGVSMSQISINNLGGFGDKMQLLGLIAPATGSNTLASTGGPVAGGYSYSGCKQSGQPDNSLNFQSGTSITSPYSPSITTVANNCWVVCGYYCQPVNLTASTGATFRGSASGTSTSNKLYCDSNSAKTPAGSVSLSVTFSGTRDVFAVIASIAPFVATANNSGFFLAAMR